MAVRNIIARNCQSVLADLGLRLELRNGFHRPGEPASSVGQKGIMVVPERFVSSRKVYRAIGISPHQLGV